MAARRLVARGVVEITQGGKVVDPSRAKGPTLIVEIDECVSAPSRGSGQPPSRPG
ncbi:MAG: DUF3253 domain-containing protein, partial [Actinomycetota bacterium]